MPAKMPASPQARFWMAMANANVSRVQPCACVIGCSHSPKPWRPPIDKVTTAAPQRRTCDMDDFGCDCMGQDCSEGGQPDAEDAKVTQRTQKDIQLVRSPFCALCGTSASSASGCSVFAYSTLALHDYNPPPMATRPS